MRRSSAIKDTKAGPDGGGASQRSDESVRGAQTVHRALEILEAFTVDRPSLSLADMSDAVGLTVPTTHRLLKALQSKNMVVWDGLTRRYSLGSGVMRLASVIVQRDDIVATAQPGMERLRTLTGETVGLHWLVGNERVCLAELVSSHPIRMASGIGRAYPVYAGAAGKAMAAWMPREQVARIVRDSGAEVDFDALMGEGEFIRSRGYAVSFGETVQGASAIAAPILNSVDNVIASINITGPTDRWTRQKMSGAALALVEVTNNIMRQIGHPGLVKAKGASRPGGRQSG